jgi:beta-glucanase (GH16 family)
MATIDLTGYHLTFDDEFNSRSLSQTGAGTTWADIRSEWRYDSKSDIGFGHSSFVDPSSGYDPFNVSGGALKITAVPDQTPYGMAGSWESGLLNTKGNFSQTYGYFEVRANFSSQPGAWDAFWLMPDKQIADPYHAGNWQELDVVEHYGGDPKSVYSTIHTTDPQNGVAWQSNRQVYSQMSSPSGYHTYGMNWQADYISFYVDGKLVGKQATPSDMHSPMYLILDLATQGADHSGNNADAAGVPISSSIDYVRVYSNDPTSQAVALQTVSSPDGHDPGLYGATAATPAVAVTQTTVPVASSQATVVSTPVQTVTTSVAVQPSSTTTQQDTSSTAVHQDTSSAAVTTIVSQDASTTTVHQDTTTAVVAQVSATPVIQSAGTASDGHTVSTSVATTTPAVMKSTDESASFSSSGYLAVNGDVAKSGIDALTHYEQYGWKEGRDPSADFDTHLYLVHNPDVQAAGLDPLMHFLQYGQFEGRQSYAAIGAASSITHGSFDPEYYLLANPDVAKAATAAGGDPFAFAYQHYTTSGWQEHRNGDAYFNAAYYLAQNPDVAASHMDPLAHYDTFGWKEGRNPSASFNTSAYLAANPDVAAAHIDPLTHYLQYGANEGRHLA